jgi:hypothetical protein
MIGKEATVDGILAGINGKDLCRIWWRADKSAIISQTSPVHLTDIKGVRLLD